MKSRFSGIIVTMAAVLTAFVVGGCTAGKRTPTAATPSKPILSKIPIAIATYPISEVSCVFRVEEFSQATSSLRGFIELANPTKQPQVVGIDGGFFLHLRVHDDNGKEVLYAKGMPVIDISKIQLKIEAEKSLRYPFDLQVADYFRLIPGIYRISFVYDERLNGVTNEASKEASPFKKWSRSDIVVKFEGK